MGCCVFRTFCCSVSGTGYCAPYVLTDRILAFGQCIFAALWRVVSLLCTLIAMYA